MKRLFIVLPLLAMLLGFSQPLPAQPQMDTPAMTSLPMMRLLITTGKTTTLIFPGEIKSVDRGSRDLLVQTVPGSGNMLQLKAAQKAFPETNLTVVTADGKLYSFLTGYSENPAAYAISVSGDLPGAFPLPLSPEARIRNNANDVAGLKRGVHGIRQNRYGIWFGLMGLYIDGEYMYFRGSIRNHTNIPYDIDFLRCELRDIRQARRTASQSLVIVPVFTTADTGAIAPSGEKTFVFVLPKFTLPDNKKLLLRLYEHNGGRHLQLALGNRVLLRAQPFVKSDK